MMRVQIKIETFCQILTRQRGCIRDDGWGVEEDKAEEDEESEEEEAQEGEDEEEVEEKEEVGEEEEQEEDGGWRGSGASAFPNGRSA